MEKKEKEKERNYPQTIEEFTELRFFAVRFRDSENHSRDVYVLRNQQGRSYILDIAQEAGLLDQNPLVPELKNTEKLTTVPLSKASLSLAPTWLSDKISNKIVGKEEEGPEEKDGKSSIMRAATLGEEEGHEGKSPGPPVAD
jgi:hypothetical protein